MSFPACFTAVMLLQIPISLKETLDMRPGVFLAACRDVKRVNGVQRCLSSSVVTDGWGRKKQNITSSRGEAGKVELVRRCARNRSESIKVKEKEKIRNRRGGCEVRIGNDSF